MDFLPCSLRLKAIRREGNMNREKRFLIEERVYKNKISLSFGSSKIM